ncbi:MAG: histidine kinase [Arcobacter sp.]|nr:MAG: histidine kinase [Arcobacter sp.]
MIIKSEKQLLNFVKYSPIIVIAIIAIIVNALIYYQNEKNYKKDLSIYKKNYIETNKNIVKTLVENVNNDIINEKNVLKEELHQNLKNRVYEAYSIVENIHNKFKNEGNEKVLYLIKEALRNLRFNEGRGYFYLFDMNGKTVLHPFMTSYEGNSAIEIKDSKGFHFIQDIIKNLDNKEEYFNSYYWTKPKNKINQYKKFTFNKKYEPLNLVISSGEYLDNFTIKLQKRMLDYIQKISFGKNGYMFVFDYDGTQIAHIKKSYIGLNRINLEDKNGYKITQEIIKKAKEGSGFISYIGTIIPQTGKPAKKTTYVKGIQDWRWAIGSGYYDIELLQYLDKKEKELKEINTQSLKKTLFISFVISIVLLYLATYISNILKTFFDDYNERISREISANRKKDVILYQQSKMASMGEMIGNIAHQWRQPLSLISTAASRIQIENELEIITKESHNESLEAIIKSTKYLSQTIDDFREFFNPHKIAKELNSEDLYEKTMILNSSRFSNKDILLIEEIENFNFITYENELIQAIINILNNAIDAFKEKEEENKFIFFSIKNIKESKFQDCETSSCDESEIRYMEIIIRDNAGGIPQNIIEKIFDAYFTTKHQAKGTGIGLYMTYQIITKHLNGSIIVENETFSYQNKEYTGAKFTITLPLS